VAPGSGVPSSGVAPGRGAPAGSLFRGRTWFWVLVVGMVTLDLWSKAWAIAWWEDHRDLRGEVPVVPGVLSIVKVPNQGTIFGLFQNTDPNPWLRPLVWLRLLAIGVLLSFLRQTRREDRLQVLALALILAGALGNLYDNYFSPNGAVRDFIQVYLNLKGGWPFAAFNVADSCISVGACLLLLCMLRKPQSEPVPAA
jgi:signal peptidase II